MRTSFDPVLGGGADRTGETVGEPALEAAARLLRGRATLVLSGAGISTESGIPDYRGPGTRRRASPMRYQEFVKRPEARRRYWARSFVGWPAVARANANAGHRAVARLEAAGQVLGVLTQNVDGLHQEAGSRRVIDLHGRLDAVRCLACGVVTSRRALQTEMARRNPNFADREAREIKPDGDADIDPAELETFRVPSCAACGGVLKPDVVFFGENVPKARVEAAWRMLAEAEAVLVVGSSLTVRSGYRFVVRAAEDGVPVVIANDGPTRGDGEARVRLTGRLGAVLPALERRLR